MLTIITLILCVTMFVRLFTYNRQGAQYRPGISLLSTVLMASCGAAAIFIIDGSFRVQPMAWPLVVVQAVFTYATIRCYGNLSKVVRGPDAWHGRERRR